MIATAYANHTYSLRRCAYLKPVRHRVNVDRLKPFFDEALRPTSELDVSDVVDDEEFSAPDIDNKSDDSSNCAPTPPAATEVAGPPGPVVVSNPQQGGSDWYTVDKLLGSFVKNGVRYFKVKWRGFKDRTWEPAENIPSELIAAYFDSVKKKRKRKSKR